MNDNQPSGDKIVGAQLAALVRRLGEGKPLTAAQLQFVREQMRAMDASRTPNAATELDEGEARNHSDLARTLGVSRQVIAYHRTRSGSPQGLSVAEWRSYLLVNAKGEVRDRLSAGSASSIREPLLRFDDGVHRLLGCIGRKLAEILKLEFNAAGVKVSPRQFDSVAFKTFMWFAIIADKAVTEHGFESVFTPFEPEPGEELGHWEPPQITEIARRIVARKQPAKRSADLTSPLL